MPLGEEQQIDKRIIEKENLELLMALRLVIQEAAKLKKEAESDPVFKEAWDRVVPFLKTLLTGPKPKADDDPNSPPGFPTRPVHYGRNQFMPIEKLPKTPEEADKWGWDDAVAADCHQFKSPDKKNVKFVSQNGKDEVIFDSDGLMITNPEDYGTYNFSNPNDNPIGHFYKDVLPWLVWGNEDLDSTSMEQRLRAFILVGGIHALGKKVRI